MKLFFALVFFGSLAIALGELPESLVEKAEGGDPQAQFELAKVLDAGLGVKSDPQKAAEWYYKAAIQGHADAADFLATLYAEGIGVPRDSVFAGSWKGIARRIRSDPNSLSSIKFPAFADEPVLPGKESPQSIDEIDKRIAELQKMKERMRAEKANQGSLPSIPARSPSGTVSFDCEIVRSYRARHKGNTKLQSISNRDLVLFLGREFEKRGEDYLEKVRQQDPLFYKYYLSLPPPTQKTVNRTIQSDRFDPFTIAKEAPVISFYLDIEKLRSLAGGRNVRSHRYFSETDTFLRAELNEFLPNLGLSYDSVESYGMGFYSVSDNWWMELMEGLDPSFKDMKYLMSAKFEGAVDPQKLIRLMKKEGHSVQSKFGAWFTDEIQDSTNPLPDDSRVGIKNLQTKESILFIGNTEMISSRLQPKARMAFKHNAFESLLGEPDLAISVRFPPKVSEKLASNLALDESAKIFAPAVRKLAGAAFCAELGVQNRARLLLRFNDSDTPKNLLAILNLIKLPDTQKTLPPFMRNLQFQQNGNSLRFDLSLTVKEFHQALDSME